MDMAGSTATLATLATATFYLRVAALAPARAHHRAARSRRPAPLWRASPCPGPSSSVALPASPPTSPSAQLQRGSLQHQVILICIYHHCHCPYVYRIAMHCIVTPSEARWKTNFCSLIANYLLAKRKSRIVRETLKCSISIFK